ncbi:hypothetical protein QC761_0067940 [Podospora bellae-mahoneyi]|uniref:Uncharacterized protein n=1 Tax=Podospora bellae-mahoneyi TaxID=2093777 RepID=A0ABR0FHK7_9PEZI|nr:hypothetical protein QC761_0067940 [Podospora bellae-mahoneyi]
MTFPSPRTTAADPGPQRSIANSAFIVSELGRTPTSQAATTTTITTITTITTSPEKTNSNNQQQQQRQQQRENHNVLLITTFKLGPLPTSLSKRIPTRG